MMRGVVEKASWAKVLVGSWERASMDRTWGMMPYLVDTVAPY